MGKHARDSHSDEDIEIEYRHQDIRQKHNELHESPSTSKSPQSEGDSQISVLTNQGSTTKTPSNKSYVEVYNSLKCDMALRVNLEVNNGEYNLKLTSVPTNNTMTENAHTAAMLLSQGKLLCKLGEKLLSQLGMSYESEIHRSLNLQLPF